MARFRHLHASARAPCTLPISPWDVPALPSCHPVACLLNSSVTLSLLFAFWKKMLYVGFAVHRAVVSGIHQCPCLLLFLRLALDELSRIRMIDIQNNHLGSATCPAALLITRRMHQTFHETTGPRRSLPQPRPRSAAAKNSSCPDPYLNSFLQSSRVRIESIMSSTELMKHAEHTVFFDAAVERTGELNDTYWFKAECQLIVKGHRVGSRGEIPP